MTDFTPVTIRGDYGPCEAWTRRLTRCPGRGHFDNYHFAILCNTHADMEDPPLTLEQAQLQRQERDNRLHDAWRERQKEAA